MNVYSLNGRAYEWLTAVLTLGRVNALKRRMMSKLDQSPLKTKLQSIKKFVAAGLFRQNFAGEVLPVVERYFQKQEIVERDDLMAFAYVGVRRDEPLGREQTTP